MVTGPVSSHPTSSLRNKKKKKVASDTSSPEWVRGESQLFPKDLSANPVAAGSASGGTRDGGTGSDGRGQNDLVTFDHLDIARKSRLVADIMDQIMESPEARNDRLAKIQRQIEAGTYHVDPEDVVAKIIENGELSTFTE